ncbi:MAG: hypothetical protein QM703_13170 [Gemmatales bacterium]
MNELYFEGLDSNIYVALEARSDTIHRLHVSERAHIKNAEDVLAATVLNIQAFCVISIEGSHRYQATYGQCGRKNLIESIPLEIKETHPLFGETMARIT